MESIHTSYPDKYQKKYFSNQNRYSPRVLINRLRYQDKEIYVVRDDVLPGGTKQRACAKLLSGLQAKGFQHFIYASPFSGFAQIALAYVCGQMNLRCTLFCEKDQTRTEKQFHAFSLQAKKFGAEIHMADSLEEATLSSHAHAKDCKNSIELPLGFDCAEFRDALKAEVAIMWNDLLGDLPEMPKNIWVPVGSGTLAKTIRTVVPDEVSLQCVNVKVLPLADQRIQRVQELKNIKFHTCSLMFYEPAVDLPEIPSNLYYDAKLWNWIKHEAKNGDLWWNVAR